MLHLIALLYFICIYYHVPVTALASISSKPHKPSPQKLSINFLTPSPNTSLQEVLVQFRHQVVPIASSPSTLVEQGNVGLRLSRCGIIWAISSINGSTTDYELLSRVGRGEGKFRLLAVIYEVLTSAAKVRTLLSEKRKLPEVCVSEAHTTSIELALFIDRDIIHGLREYSLIEDLKCTFDRVIYFDDLPPIEKSLAISPYKKLHMLVRLAPRPNVMKLVAFLSTPYEYTLYLDGDTAPCSQFQEDVFSTLTNHDLLVTPNPFPFVSTNGQKTYRGSPVHPSYPDFPEVNGGVMAYNWNQRTEKMIIRTLELFPYFAQLGYDQDQAMMRHALFESIHVHGLKVFSGKMNQYCRFGWKCELNSCAAGCVIVHQRACLGNATGVVSTTTIGSDSSKTSRNRDRKGMVSNPAGQLAAKGGKQRVLLVSENRTEYCAARARTASHNSFKFNNRNTVLNKENRRIGRVKVLSGTMLH